MTTNLQVRPAFLVAVAWLSWGLFRASQQIAVNNLLQRHGSSAEAILLASLLAAGSWGLVTPAIVVLTRRSMPEGRVRARALALVAPAVAVASLLVATLYTAACRALWLLPRDEGLVDLTRRIFLGRLPFYLATGATVVCVTVFLDAFRSWRRAALAASRLETQLAEARLETLKTHLNPPFFFSTLSTILPLIPKNPDVAASLVVKLGDLLRMTFKSEGRTLLTLGEELSLLELYLEIEKVRFADRLTVSMRVEPGARDALVPTLITQPLAELVIACAVSRRVGGCRIEASARVQDSRLVVSLRESGADEPDAAQALPAEPDPLAEARERLARLYGDAAELSFGAGPAGGHVATFAIPATYPERHATLGGTEHDHPDVDRRRRAARA